MFEGIPLLALTPEAESVAAAILEQHLMPQKAAADALHVAIAASAGVDYLLTQNCKHIANAHELPRVYNLLASLSHSRLLICTPAEFLGGDRNNET